MYVQNLKNIIAKYLITFGTYRIFVNK